MHRIDQRERRDLRMTAALHGFELRDDGVVRSKASAANRSYGHLERMKQRRARGHG